MPKRVSIINKKYLIYAGEKAASVRKLGVGDFIYDVYNVSFRSFKLQALSSKHFKFS